MAFWRGSNQHPWIDRMRSIWLLADCSTKEIRFISSLCTPLDVPEGRTLVRQGDRSSQFLITARGTAVAAVDHRPIALVEAGSFFGESTLLGEGIDPATVISATPMELLVFNANEGMALLEAPIPSVRDRIVAVVAERRKQQAELAVHAEEPSLFDQLRDLPALQRVTI
ncbi:MAG: Crp/Fnr family transcriptional regulator [Acidimicrobiales bacterium]